LKYSAGPGIRIVLELASDIPKCLIDQSQFDAAVLNLVVNARDQCRMAARFGSAQSGGWRKPRSPARPRLAPMFEFASRTAVKASLRRWCGRSLIHFSRPRVRKATVWDCHTFTHSCGGSAAMLALPASGEGGRPSISCFPPE